MICSRVMARSRSSGTRSTTRRQRSSRARTPREPRRQPIIWRAVCRMCGTTRPARSRSIRCPPSSGDSCKGGTPPARPARRSARSTPSLRASRGRSIDSVDAKLYLESASPQLDAHLAAQLKSALGAGDVKVTSQAMTDPVTVFDDKFDVPWEVDDLRARVRADVLPKVKAGAKVELEARVSESPEMRVKLADEIRTPAETGGRVRRASVRALGVQTGISLAHRACDSGTERKERQRPSHQDRDVSPGPFEEIQVLHGAEPVAAGALPGRRNRPA